MMRSYARAAAFGTIATMLVWLALITATGVALARRPGDVSLSVGPAAAPLTYATRTGDHTSITLQPLGYVLALVPLAVALLVVGRHRAGRRRQA